MTIRTLTEPKLDAIIRGRLTTKVMSSEPLPTSEIRDQLDGLIATAGWAPFHRPCGGEHQIDGGLPGIEPWRMYGLDAVACRKLRLRLPIENAGKIPQMLAAADALIQVTWLPNAPSCTEQPENACLFEPTLDNLEHIAAAAAAIQNLLLAATAQGFLSYWSSGGLLRSQEVCSWLEIPPTEILLGAIFLFHEAVGHESTSVTRVGSKLRERRHTKDGWMRWVSL